MQGEILFYFIILTFQSLQSNQVHNLPATFHLSLKFTCSTHLINRYARQHTSDVSYPDQISHNAFRLGQREQSVYFKVRSSKYELQQFTRPSLRPVNQALCLCCVFAFVLSLPGHCSTKVTRPRSVSFTAFNTQRVVMFATALICSLHQF